MKKYSYLFFALLLTFTACKNSELVRPGDPINVSYQKGMNQFESDDYNKAAEIFEVVTRSGRGTNFAKDAQYYLAESYFNARRYILAAAEYERFSNYYPQDERRQEVDYKHALSVYEQSPRYRLDQTQTRKAIELFQLYISKYPNSEFISEASDRITELRSKLARKIFESAEFYARTDMFKAATIYYDQVIDQYPESKWTELALVKKIETFVRYADNSIVERQEERYGEAIAAYETFLQLFPNSEYRQQVEDLRDQAERGQNQAISILADQSGDGTNQ